MDQKSDNSKGPIFYGLSYFPVDVKTGQIVNEDDSEVAAMLEHNRIESEKIFGIELEIL